MSVGKIIPLSIVLALLSQSSFGAPQSTEPVWHWIWVVPAPDPTKGWTVFEGDAPVSFNGLNLRATLNGKREGWEPELRVEGKVKGETIDAVITQIGTDAEPERYRGGVRHWRSKPTDGSAGWGGVRIWLDAGPNHLGFYREFPPQ